MSALDDRRACPHCGHPQNPRPYVMSVDPDAPGLLDLLRGACGETWRLAVTVAVCVLVVLIATGLYAALAR